MNARALSTDRLLLAEDDLINQHVLLRMLKHLGYSAEVVNNGLEVLEACTKRSYALILMDGQMPLMDGYEATRRLREARLKTPIVALSGTGEGMEGANEQLMKPITLSSLQKALARWFKPLEESSAARETPIAEESQRPPELCALFCSLAPAQVEAILCLQDKRLRVEAAHRLKGSALLLGLPRLAAVCALIEQHNSEALGPLRTSLQEALHASLDALQSKP